MSDNVLHRKLQAALDSRRRRGSLRSLKADAIDSTMHEFSSNDYLDLSASPELRLLFRRYIEASPSLASTGSRLLSGNSQLANGIEEMARRYWASRDALLCASGYEANVAIFSTIPQPGDVVLYDELIHASVHVGLRHSRAAKKLAFRHDDMHHLSQLLSSERRAGAAAAAAAAPLANSPASVFVAVETVYSMDGDTASLREIIGTIRRELPRARLILDEAHATGIYGPSGRGLLSALQLADAPEVLIRLHTFGKGAGGTGAMILCDTLVKQYLLNYAKGLIYSTFMSVPALCLLRASLALLSADNETLTRGDDEDSEAIREADPCALRCRALWDRVHYLSSLLHRPDSATLFPGLEFADHFASPIIPIRTSRAVELSDFLRSRGFRVMPVRYPTVPRGQERIRICLRAEIPYSVIESLVETMGLWARHGSSVSQDSESPLPPRPLHVHQQSSGKQTRLERATFTGTEETGREVILFQNHKL